MSAMEDAVQQLVNEVPEFLARYRADTMRWGKLLPVSVLSGFAEFVGHLVDTPGRSETELLDRSLSALEHLWECYDHEAMTTLLGTGFLESFDQWLPKVRHLFGPGLRSLVEAEEAWIAERLERGIGVEPGDRRA